MEDLLKELIEAYDGVRGCNTLSVPLINSARMAEIWKAQKKHIPCLMDLPGFQLCSWFDFTEELSHEQIHPR